MNSFGLHWTLWFLIQNKVLFYSLSHLKSSVYKESRKKKKLIKKEEINGWLASWLDLWVDGWTDGVIDGWMDGRIR